MVKIQKISESKSILASSVISKAIFPDDDVLAVGPHRNVNFDPSPLFTAHILNQGTGSLTIVDTEARDKSQYWGDLKAYEKDMEEYLTNYNIPVKPKYLFSDARNLINIDSGSFDVVLDHTTLRFIVFLFKSDPNEIMKSALDSYMRVLRNNGRMILMMDNGEPHPLPFAEKYLFELGYPYECLRIEDQYHMYLKEKSKNFESTKVNGEWHVVLGPWHKCNRILVAYKDN